MVKRPPADALVYPPHDNPDAPRTLKAAAAHFGVNLETVRRWIKAGHLAEFRSLGPGPIKHGTMHAYRGRKCRCAECREWNNQFFRRARDRRSCRLDSAPHGTDGGYSNWGCRCEECSAAHREQMIADRRSRIERAKADPSTVPTHGLAGYFGWGCRCDECAAAARDQRRAARMARIAQAKADPSVIPAHGVLSSYFQWGCRCDLCRAALSAYNRARYAARKAGER